MWLKFKFRSYSCLPRPERRGHARAKEPRPDNPQQNARLSRDKADPYSYQNKFLFSATYRPRPEVASVVGMLTRCCAQVTSAEPMVMRG